MLELYINQTLLALICCVPYSTDDRLQLSTMIPGVLIKIQAKSSQSVSQVLPHDCAFSNPLHINNQSFVEVQKAAMGMTYRMGHKDERSLEACFSKKWRQSKLNAKAFSIHCLLSNHLAFESTSGF